MMRMYGLGRILLVSLVLGTVVSTDSARADLRETRHNLSGRKDVSSSAGRAEREICVFCHTPGASEVEGAAGEASAPYWPQWQRSVEASFSFELFDDIGRGGSDAGQRGAVGSVSVACLSCHDGVQALGVMQGSGSDHPFGVPYRGVFRGGAAAASIRDRLVAAQDSPTGIGGLMGDDVEFRPARTATVNRRQIWWAATTSNTAQRAKSDLPLYPRRVVEGPGTYSQIPFVECTSCHDPHSTREVFMRTTNEGSKLCMACHIK